MAESINEGTLASFSANIGDSIEADQELATVETDKIDVPINSPEAGVFVEYLTEEGNTVSVGQIVAVIETQDDDSQAEMQIKDNSSQLNPSPSASGGSAKPSTNVGTPNLCGERVVRIRSQVENFHFVFQIK